MAPECATIAIPPHEHRVRLGLTHTELTADYGLRENLNLSLRLPYDVKAMHVRYTTLSGAPYTPPYGDIHHRTETLSGLSDPSFDLVWSPHADWLAAIGTTFPAGQTEPDPIALGRAGQPHEHIQFGSGTFEPRIALQWSNAHLFARGEAKLSLYENRHGFRAPSTFVWSLGPSLRAGRLSIDPRFNGQYQTLGRWNGEVDEGAGFANGGVRLQLSMPLGGVVVAPSVYHELWSRGLDEQTFRQGNTLGLAVVWTK